MKTHIRTYLKLCFSFPNVLLLILVLFSCLFVCLLWSDNSETLVETIPAQEPENSTRKVERLYTYERDTIYRFEMKSATELKKIPDISGTSYQDTLVCMLLKSMFDGNTLRDDFTSSLTDTLLLRDNFVIIGDIKNFYYFNTACPVIYNLKIEGRELLILTN